MKRRELLQWAAASAAVAGCGGSGGGSTTPDGRPNVLMIAIDDLNEWVGFLGGHPQVRTPALDALAARSHVFPNAFCTAPVCSPSRAGVLSGLSVQSTGVKDNYATFKSVNPNKRTFDEMLAGAGYEVQRFGKVDHTYNPFVSPLPATMPYTNKQCAARNDEGAFDWGPVDVDDTEMPDYKYAQQGIDLMNQRQTAAPFCLSVGFVRTHVGWYVPQRFFDMYPIDSVIVPRVPADELNDIGPVGKSIALKFNFHQCIVGQSLWASAVQGYLASISWVDSQIARLIEALDASPYANNTMVVLWSDHGFHLGEKFHWHKEALWDVSTRVPCLVRMPGQGAGVRQAACISLRDLAPTMLANCGVSSDYPMDGRSLLPLLNNPQMAWDHPVLTTLDGQHHAVRTAQWRYIRYATGERELYDESNDPTEYVNIAGLGTSEAVMAELDALMPARTG